LQALSSHRIHPVLLDSLEDVDTAKGGFGVVRRARLHRVDTHLSHGASFKLVSQDRGLYVVPAKRSTLGRLIAFFYPQYQMHPVMHTTDVAVKGLTFSSHAALSRVKRRFAREILVWMQLDHPNVLPLLGFHLDFNQNFTWFVSPWRAHGSISNYITEKRPNIDEVLRLLEGTARGLTYLHNHNPTVCHGDIKAANVLVGSQCQALLCDFGLATMLDFEYSGLETSQSFEGSIRWCSPELFDAGKRTMSSDIWAWGFLVYEVITERLPFYDAEGPTVVMRRILDGQLPTAQETPEFDTVTSVWGLLQWCWAMEPKDRPTINECLSELQSFTSSMRSSIEIKSLPPSYSTDLESLNSDAELSGVDSPPAPGRNHALDHVRGRSIRESGMVGGHGGSPFSDFFSVNKRLRGVTVYSHLGIHQIQVLYERDGELSWADEHGTIWGPWDLSKEEFLLAPGEVINRIEGRSGDKIDALQFFTNTGRSSKKCGGPGGCPFTWKGRELLFFSGRAGGQLDALQAHWSGRPMRSD